MSPIPAAPSRARRSIARARKVPATMKTTPDQLSLSLFDTTALTSSMGLYAGLSFGELADDLIETEEDTPAPVVIHARNFRLTSARRLAPEWKARAADNIAAIRLMLEIEEEARNATPDEQERLALFTSFGAGDLANNLFRRSPDEVFPKGWETLGGELEELVSPAELTSLARVTQYAHFTPEFIVRFIWRALSRMGFFGGRVLEPGCGTGLFFALMPEALEDKTTLTGVEMDPVTARIAKLLYPNARIRAEDFTKARIPDSYDLVIGNPPFSSRTVRADDPAGQLSLSLHDYFIARSIERLRPGGLAAFVTSRWTLDKADPTARTFLASMADLVGAVRLPEGAMRAAAGTEVVVDILFYQKRGPDEPAKQACWIDLAEVMAAQDEDEAITINRYFVERPTMALGSHARTSSAYGPTYTCEPLPGGQESLIQDLLAALHTLPADIYAAPAPERPERETLIDETIHVGTAAEGATIKEGSYLVVKDRLAQIVDGMAVAVPIRNCKGSDGIPARHARIIRGLVQIRDAVRAVLRAQEADLPWGGAQIRLRGFYAHFKREFGPINLTTISETAGPDGEFRERSAARTFSPSSTIPTSGSSPRSRTTTSRPASPGRARSSPSECSIRLSRRRSRAPLMRSRSRCTRPAWSTSTASPSFSASRASRRSRSSGTGYSSTRRRAARASRPGGRPTPISPAQSARSSRSRSTPRSRIHASSATSRRSRRLCL